MGNVFCPPAAATSGERTRAAARRHYDGLDAYDASDDWRFHDVYDSTKREWDVEADVDSISSATIVTVSQLCRSRAAAAAAAARRSSTPPLPLPHTESVALLGEHANRSPYRDYEVVRLMGSGSMGEVCKVKRKPRPRRKATMMSTMTRSARSCGSLRSVAELISTSSSTSTGFYSSFLVGGGGEPSGKGRAVLPSSLANTNLTFETAPMAIETSSSEDDDDASAASSSCTSSPGTSAPPSRNASFCVLPSPTAAGRGSASASASASVVALASSSPPRPPTKTASASLSCVRPAASVDNLASLLKSKHGATWGTAMTRCSRRPGVTTRHHPVFYALKSIHLRNLSDDVYKSELRNEIEILKRLDHPNIVRAIETYEHWGKLYLLLELCSGGDLYVRDPYTEPDAKRIVGGVLSAVAYMHKKGVVHRDLKYENVMFVDSKPDADVKIIDFGLSKKYRPGDPYLKTGVGTIYTMAPEVFRGEYTSQADVWSVGVMAYMLLSSHLPFYGKTRQEVISKILLGRYHFKGRCWKEVSSEARYFVSSLLKRNPDHRPTAAEALRLPWLSSPPDKYGATTTTTTTTMTTTTTSGTDAAARNASAPTEIHGCIAKKENKSDETKKEYIDQGSRTIEKEDIDLWVASSLRSYEESCALKKLALLVIAHRSTSAEIGRHLRELFHRLGGERDGVVSKSEAFDAAAKFLLSGADSDEDGCGTARASSLSSSSSSSSRIPVKEALDRLRVGVDKMSHDKITYTEFLAATIESTGNISTARLAEAFDHLDADGCGYISVADLRAVLGEDVPRDYIDQVIDEADLTEDHRISFEEFLSLW